MRKLVRYSGVEGRQLNMRHCKRLDRVETVRSEYGSLAWVVDPGLKNPGPAVEGGRIEGSKMKGK